MKRTHRETLTVTWTTRPRKDLPGGGFTTDFDAPPRQHTARVAVEIDTDAIALHIGTKAARNTTGRSTAYSGCIRAKVLR
jgi:hypothetical protein